MKPYARGYIHQIALIISIVACGMLILHTHGIYEVTCIIVYSISLVGMYGMSTFYHCPNWSHKKYLLLKKFDHAAIYILIAGTATPICLLGLKSESRFYLLSIIWICAIIGIILTTFWSQKPKWFRSLFYVIIGWLAIIFLPDMRSSLDISQIRLLLIDGIIYTLGALIYACKWPNPLPKYFGYHEIFHLLVVIASGFHYVLIYSLSSGEIPLLI